MFTLITLLAVGAQALPYAPAPLSDRASCKCGIKRSSNRIVNGVQAGVNEFPWIAGMIQILDGMETDSMCGGTLVADKWIVTAAHCLYKDNDFKTLLKPSEQVWVLGEHDWFDTSETKIPTKRFPVEKVLVHPKWDSLNTKNDIALIKLKTSADLTKYTPACLANTGDNFVGKTAWVYGWGQTAFKADFGSSVLLKLQVKVASNQECIDWSKKAFGLAAWELGTGQLCAGAGAGKDACKGDSGGPLTTDVGGRQVLIGDVSNGNACKGPYAVFGAIADFRQWIDSTMESNGGATFCAA